MDFFQFLEISKKNINKSPKKDVTEIKEFYFKTGDFIKVKNKTNSKLNIYKGYIGEIRSYTKGQDYAFVMLDALYNQPFIKFPLDHLEIRQ